MLMGTLLDPVHLLCFALPNEVIKEGKEGGRVEGSSFSCFEKNVLYCHIVLIFPSKIRALCWLPGSGLSVSSGSRSLWGLWTSPLRTPPANKALQVFTLTEIYAPFAQAALVLEHAPPTSPGYQVLGQTTLLVHVVSQVGALMDKCHCACGWVSCYRHCRGDNCYCGTPLSTGKPHTIPASLWWLLITLIVKNHPSCHIFFFLLYVLSVPIWIKYAFIVPIWFHHILFKHFPIEYLGQLKLFAIINNAL